MACLPTYVPAEYAVACSFNQLDLPEYDSYERLRQKLLCAITEGSEGFGFG